MLLTLLNAGEWWISNVGFGLVFLVACTGAGFLGWYVLRAEAINRDEEFGWGGKPTDSDSHQH